MRKTLSSLCLLLLAVCPPLHGAEPGLTVMIIRHAEKAAGTGLTHEGEERATKYAHFFQGPLLPDILFAAHDTEGSMRPRLTLEPLAHALSLPVDTTYKARAPEELATVLKSGKFSGQRVLVCWHHGDIPKLLAELGGDPQKILPHGEWPEAVFNWMIELHFDGRGALQSSRVINEKLLPGDRDP